MFLRPPGINIDGNDYKEERMRYFAEHYLDQFDVICMQEVFSLLRDWKGEMIDLAQKAGIPYHVCNPNPSFFSYQLDHGGLLILSRYPIIESDFHEFESPPILADIAAAKGVLYAKIEIPSSPQQKCD